MKISVNPENGQLNIQGKYSLIPFESVPNVLNSEIYKQFSLDNTSLEKMQIQKRILLNFNDDNDWILSLNFKEQKLRTVFAYLKRESFDEVKKNDASDYEYYQNLIKEQFKSDKTHLKFPWGLLKITKNPDDIFWKILIRYAGSGGEAQS